MEGWRRVRLHSMFADKIIWEQDPSFQSTVLSYGAAGIQRISGHENLKG